MHQVFQVWRQLPNLEEQARAGGELTEQVNMFGLPAGVLRTTSSTARKSHFIGALCPSKGK